MIRFKEVPAKCKGIPTKRTDIGIQVKRTFRLYCNTKPKLTQSR